MRRALPALEVGLALLGSGALAFGEVLGRPGAGEGGFDVAIIDVNLNGEQVWPVADRLAAQGVPYVLATGGHIDPPPAQHASVPVLSKPFTLDAIEPALAEACSR